MAVNTVISACGQAARWDRTLALLENMVPGQDLLWFRTAGKGVALVNFEAAS